MICWGKERRVLEYDVDDVFTSDEDHTDEISIPLSEMVKRLQCALESIPAEHRDAATFNVSATGEYARAHLSVRYHRTENDEEYASRIAAEEVHERHGAAMREKKERAEYERLKRKFGGA